MNNKGGVKMSNCGNVFSSDELSLYSQKKDSLEKDLKNALIFARMHLKKSPALLNVKHFIGKRSGLLPWNQPPKNRI